MSRWRFFGFAAAFEGGLFVFACLLAWAFNIPFWDQLHLGLPAVAAGVGLALPPIAAGVAMAEMPLPAFDRLRDDFSAVVALFTQSSLVEILLISLLAGISEETLFRGVMQAYASAYIGVPLAIVLVGVLFGVVHAVSPSYAVYAALMGIYLGATYAFSGNLVVPIVLHAFYNFAAIVYGVRIRPIRPGH